MLLISGSLAWSAEVTEMTPTERFQPPTSSANDEEFARLVKEWTTKPEFLSPLVDHLPKCPAYRRGSC